MNNPISFTLTDSESGVDIDSLEYTVTGSRSGDIPMTQSIDPQASDNDIVYSYNVTLTPNQNYQSGEEVTIALSVDDNMHISNNLSTLWSFTPGISSNGFIATTPASSGGPQVLLYTPDGSMISNFMAYDESLRGDFKSLAGNLRGTGEDELITFPGQGFGPQLRVFKADGTPLASTMVYNEAFRGGMNATVGDFNGDGLDEIAVAPESSGGAQVMVYRMEGNELKLMAQFEAYEEGYMGGLNLSSGDTDASGRDALITVPTTGNTSHVKLFNYNNGSFNLGPHTFAFGEDFRGGTNVTTGDLNGNGQAEIIVSPESNGGPNVRIYSQTGGTLTLLDWTFAYQEDFFGGVNITTGDLTGDGKAELITAPMSEGGPNLRVYTLNDSTLDLLDWLFVYDEDFQGGLNIVVQDLNNDGKAELVTSPRSHGGPNVRTYTYTDKLDLLGWFFAYAEGFHGGVNLSLGRRG